VTHTQAIARARFLVAKDGKPIIVYRATDSDQTWNVMPQVTFESINRFGYYKVHKLITRAEPRAQEVADEHTH
jgi:hypothetical protein